MFTKITIGALLFIQILFFSAKKDSPEAMEYSFYVGTYTQEDSEGIYRYLLQTDGTLKKVGLAAKDDNPSFLTKSPDGRYLLAVNELGNDAGEGGTVKSYAIEGDKLTLIDEKPSAGSYPCFVSVDEAGNVLTANYGSGTVGLLQLSSSGSLTGPSDILKHTGQGTTSRQKGPHAHSAWFDPNGDAIITVDLGTNELWFSHLDDSQDKLLPMNPPKLAMPAGAGPRHMAFHPSKPWAYVINELSSTVTQLRNGSSGQYEIVNTVSTLPDGFSGDNFCADIHMSADGKFLYASNRGHNSIAIYQVGKSDGSLKLVGHEATRGEWPRNFSLSPDGAFLLVANQNSNNIVSFKRDAKKGTLTLVDEIEAPSPVCLLF